MPDSQRNLPIIHQLIGDGFLPNMIFALNGWSNPPTSDQITRDNQARAQKPFSSNVQRVNWSSGPSRRDALDIVRMAMNKEPGRLAIQQEIIERRLQLSDTAAGRTVIQHAKQIAQQLRNRNDMQGAQKADRIDGKLREGFQKELNKWPKRPNQPRPAPGTRPGSNAKPPASGTKNRPPGGRPAQSSSPGAKKPGPGTKPPGPAKAAGNPRPPNGNLPILRTHTQANHCVNSSDKATRAYCRPAHGASARKPSEP